MVSARCDDDGIIGHLVDQTMLVIDPPRPIPCQLMFERLRFSQTRERAALDVSNQFHDLGIDPFVLACPTREILKGASLKEYALHFGSLNGISIRLVPASMFASASRRRRLFASDFSR